MLQAAGSRRGSAGSGETRRNEGVVGHCGGIRGGTRRNEGSSVPVGESGVVNEGSVVVGQSGEEPGVTRGRRSLWGNQGW